VIVVGDEIIGEGYTSPYGGNHAEVNAVASIKDKSTLSEATMYVTLEPCSHVGKTPPCADLIVKHQFKKVVIGCVDTNSLVAGKGIERLKNAGIEVVVGVLEKECQKHHKRFFTVQNKNRPYIVLKWAETKNGFIAPLKKDTQKPVWISNIYSQQLVHKWRSEEHAILVGTNTVLEDNPSLTVRSWQGEHPIRIVLDRSLRIPKEATVFDGNVKTIVLTQNESREAKEHVIFKEIDFSKNVAQQICDVLQKHHIQSVIIEGGATTLQTFIDASLWDEARVFVGDVVFDDGVKAPDFIAQISSEEKIINDTLRIYYHD
jgi:diaminohydroxyphosphoribosylaminopyrimidine deaminase/5-amino-6-(5-phosphoribosylamino)uracil reductase